MWQVFLERFIPVMEDDPSLLDVRDGLGASFAVRSGATEHAGAVVRPDGSLADDFVIEQTRRAVHVVNAPSPAATASLTIGDEIATLALDRL